ncbi:hypothetical protein ELY21_01180 [Legionella sp. km535]|uniref:hypothetical protein n=1 Tax=Legionella sp. km535 TaxID=2498107 RepID=UPI000F8C6E0B|nr:hypothetical protein [Legionella sp. km535]RUR20726.1 hypothetical protein ELY21_01180 [Legionella sp. km535]
MSRGQSCYFSTCPTQSIRYELFIKPNKTLRREDNELDQSRAISGCDFITLAYNKAQLELEINTMNLKAFTFGAEGVGKTELIKKLSNPDYTNQPGQRYNRSIGADFSIIQIPDREGIKKTPLSLWDMSGNPKFRGISSCFFPNSDFGFACVDLSKPLDQQTIDELNDDLALFRQLNPDALLILVGTKSDAALPNALENAQQQFAPIPFLAAVPTSARNADGSQELLNLITLEARKLVLLRQEEELNKTQELLNEIEQRKTILNARNRCIEDSELYRALDQLNDKAQNLSPEIIKILGIETHNLLDTLEDRTIYDKEPCLKSFVAKCNKAIKGTHYELKSALLALAYAAAVTVIAAVIGFGIGFALGAWTGPGALFTGLAAGSASAVSVAVGASVSGTGTLIYAAHHFFKPTPLLNSINHVAQHANGKDIQQFNSSILFD